MAAQTPVTIEQYLTTDYRPDVEFLDGELKERSETTWLHSRFQTVAAAWFGRHEEEWGVLAGLNTRLRVSPTRVRLVDLVIVPAGKYPSTLVETPLIVVEVLTSNDSYSATLRRVQDYQRMGIENIWLVDTDVRTAWVCRTGGWKETTRPAVPKGPVYLDAVGLFARLERIRNQKFVADERG